jgi:hypothetical protein
MNIHQDQRQPHTGITPHEEEIAASESAVREILSGDLQQPVKEAISLADKQKHRENNMEFGVSMATLSKTNTTYIGGPTKGYRPRTAPTAAPENLIAEHIDSAPQSGDVYLETTCRFPYSDLISIHTHPIHTNPIHTHEVGLSATDLKDDIPAGDNLSESYQPFDIYRAKGAIVFADDPNRLPITTIPDHRWDRVDTLSSTGYQPRPWLHLIERTPQANKLTEEEANDLHYRTLSPYSNTSSESAKYTEAYNRISDYVSEIVMPLSP